MAIPVFSGADEKIVPGFEVMALRVFLSWNKHLVFMPQCILDSE
jgi:hypothetical protein